MIGQSFVVDLIGRMMLVAIELYLKRSWSSCYQLAFCCARSPGCNFFAPTLPLLTVRYTNNCPPNRCDLCQVEVRVWHVCY